MEFVNVHRKKMKKDVISESSIKSRQSIETPRGWNNEDELDKVRRKESSRQYQKIKITYAAKCSNMTCDCRERDSISSGVCTF